MIDYYAARVAEYERIYAKPERQADLAELRTVVAAFFKDSHVLEIACGTGYWTEVISTTAASVAATDLVPEVLEAARTKPYPPGKVSFRQADAYDLSGVEGEFGSCFAGFWWSHVPRQRLQEFLCTLHKRLGPGAKVMFLDNRYVEGSSTPCSRVDTEDNTYQIRHLEDGTEYEVLKNFPQASEVENYLLKTGAGNVKVVELEYYWYVTYIVANAIFALVIQSMVI